MVARHIVYETNYWSTLSQSLVPVYIDVVRKDALEDMLSILEKEVADVNGSMKKTDYQKRLSEIVNERMH